MTETCTAKIRPLPDETELRCELGATPHDEHQTVLRDYAYEGSETKITWADDDRRTFRGEWAPCEMSGCVLPAAHHGNHAY